MKKRVCPFVRVPTNTMMFVPRGGQLFLVPALRQFKIYVVSLNTPGKAMIPKIETRLLSL